MKKLILLCCCLCTVFFAQAQFKFGVRAGLSTQDVAPGELLVNREGNSFSNLGISVADANYGMHFGIFAQVQIEKFFIQPEILFNTNSTDFSVRDFGDGEAVDFVLNESYQHLDIPLMMGAKFGPLRLQGGPVAHIFLNSSSELFDLEGYRQDFDEMTYGWQAGIGLDIWKIVFDVKYEGQFNKFGDHINFDNNGYSFNERPGRFIATVGFTF
ncbi:MAG: outer membrane beta-barrel protein [Bacteroidota bacterium]